MFNILFAVIIFSLLFLIFLFSVVRGRQYALKQMKIHSLAKIEIIAVVEGAVFALLGLIVAFTFTSAYDRFDARKQHMMHEANAVETAYLRLDMLIPNTTIDLRQNIRQYIDTRLSIYKLIPDFTAINREIEKSYQLQHKIWEQVLTACKIRNDQTVTQLLIPAINDMFDAENTGYAMTRIHPPIVVYLLLIGLAALSAFLAGYASAEMKNYRSIYIYSYVAITAFIIYMIIDIELPRMGLIRVDAFDQFLINVRHHMN